MISDLPLISGGIPAHGTTAVLSQPQWVVGAALPIWPRYLHRRQLKIVLKHSWKTLSTQNGSIVFGHSIHYICSHFTCVIWHCISLDPRMFWPGEKKVWVFVFGSVINVTQMLVGWCGVLSLFNTDGSISALKSLPGNVLSVPSLPGKKGLGSQLALL